MTNRHFAVFEQNKEEVIILGYRQKTNDVLVAFPSALQHAEAQALRNIVQGAEAQKKDYLMDQVGGSILASAHHPSGVDWQTFLIRQAATGRSSVTRKVTMKDLTFQDQSQKAFFGGYGPSIEPEVDARRKNRIQAQDAVMRGAPIPEPAIIPEVAAMAPAPAPASAVNDALVNALAKLAESQSAIMDRLDRLETAPAAKKKPAPKRKPAAKARSVREESPAASAGVTNPTIADDLSMTASSYGGDE